MPETTAHERTAPDTDLTDDSVADALFHTITTAGDPTLIVGPIGERLGIAWANRAFIQKVRAEVADLALVSVSDLLVCPYGELPLNERRSAVFPVAVVGRDGSTSSWEATATPVSPVGSRRWVVSLRPPTADGQLDELLRASEERFRALAERAPIGIFSSEVGLRFDYVNDRLADLIGVPSERLLGTGWMDHVLTGDLESVLTGLQQTLDGTPFETPARLTTGTGEERWVNVRAVPVRAVGTPAAFLGTIEDVTDRRRFEELLEWQATHDPLTRLPNRAQLMSEINSALADGNDNLAVLFLDLDDFKTVNDTLGHGAGDELLIAVSDRLRNAVRDEDHVFRFAGDEFVVLTRGADDDHQAVALANRLREMVTRPTILAGHPVGVGCSVGVVRASMASTAEELIRDADVAMYRAKRSGKGSAAVFDLSVRSEMERHRQLVARVQTALAEHSFAVAYQVEIDAATRAPRGVDLSLDLPDGWDDVTMDEVKDAIEQSKSEAELIAFLVSRGADDLVTIRQSIDDCRVSISVTPSQLMTPGLVDQIARSLLSKGLSSRDLELRIPDEAWTPEDPQLASVVAELAALGVGIALDDVGGGRTSLRLLGHPSMSGLRLSADLLDDQSAAARAAIGALVDVANGLGLSLSAPIRAHSQLGFVGDLGISRVLDSSADPIPLDQLLAQVAP